MLKTLFDLVFFSNKSCHFSSASVDKNSGWTFFEIMIVSAITSIFASMAIPNMMENFGKNKAQSGLTLVKGALFEAQRNAIRMGKECKISLNTTNNGFSSPSIVVYDESQYAGCLSEEVSLDGLILTKNTNSTMIRFSYKGNTTNLTTIVVESPNAKSKYCLVVSNFLGIMRSGIYSGTTTSGVDSDYCKSSI